MIRWLSGTCCAVSLLCPQRTSTPRRLLSVLDYRAPAYLCPKPGVQIHLSRGSRALLDGERLPYLRPVELDPLPALPPAHHRSELRHTPDVPRTDAADAVLEAAGAMFDLAEALVGGDDGM